MSIPLYGLFARHGDPVGLALGAQAGEKRLAEIMQEAGFGTTRRVAETLFKIVLETRVAS